jgi:hypothetical protein
VEVGLLHPALLHGDLEVEGGGESVDGAAHHLGVNAERVHDAPDIDGADAAVDLRTAIRDAHLHRVRRVAAEGEVGGEAEAVAFR